MIKVAITDDHPLVIEGIVSLLREEPGIEVISTYTDGEKTLESIPGDLPDVLLLDINLPGMDGIEVCKKLMDQNKDLRILTISSFKESGLVKSMIQAGASGYLLKNADKSILIEAIHAVYTGEQYIQKELNEQLVAEALNKPVQSSYIPRLTRREKEVLQLIIDEFTTQEIAEKLSISPKTVETHRLNLLLKLEAKNTAGLVKIALQKNLV